MGFTASFVFMCSIEGALVIEGYALPDGVIPLDQAAPVPMETAPAFLRNHLETRVALPLTRNKADLCRWVRARDRDGLDPEVECLLCVDALPPAIWPLVSLGVPVSSMHWQVNMLNAAPAVDGWWLVRSTSAFAQAGAVSEHTLQWHADGTPSASGMQSVAVFG